MTLQEAILIARNQSELSQAALAENASLSRDTIQRIEEGKMMPSFNTLVKLVRGLGAQASITIQVDGMTCCVEL